MRPLQLVNPANLEPGKTYLIESKRPEYRHLNCKGNFIKNEYPIGFYGCTCTLFNNVVVSGNHPYMDLCLQDIYWNYYKADAVEQSYINYVLREITGDPSFIFTPPVKN